MSQSENTSEHRHSPGEICWLEIPCTDPDRAFAFYREVFGWEPTSGAPQPMPGYMDGVEGVYMFNKGKLSGAFIKMTKPEDVAGVADTTNPARTPMLPTFMVEDTEATLAVVEKNGGRVHLSKILIAGGTMGQCARFIDTEGNLVGIWSPPAKM